MILIKLNADLHQTVERFHLMVLVYGLPVTGMVLQVGVIPIVLPPLYQWIDTKCSVPTSVPNTLLVCVG